MGDRFGNYELIRRIGQGGMAEVWLARFCGVQGFERRLVIKRMLPELAVRKEFVDMFLDEARLAARFNHPNIVQVFELGEQGGTYFMAMEYVEGPHLGALFAHSLRLKKPLPIPLCCFVLARAAEGLHHAHELKDNSGAPLGIVHRDVSPQNVLVSRQGDVKIMDFGVAKATTQTSETRTGVVKGKVSYMSPEQCLAKPMDRRTDVFALGIILHELCARKRLYKDKNDLLVMQKITMEEVEPPSKTNPRISPELDAVVMNALQRAVDQRTPSALELSDQIDAYLAGLPEPPTRATLSRWLEEHAAELIINADQETGSNTPSWPQGTAPSGVVSRTASRSSAATATLAPAPALPAAPVASPDEATRALENTADDQGFDANDKTPVTGAEHAARRRGPLVGLAAFVVTASLVGGWVFTRPSAPRTAPVPVPAPVADAPSSAGPAPAAPESGGSAPSTLAGVRVMTDPPGAEVSVNGESRGRTGDAPLLVKDLPADKPAKLVVTLDGYDTARVEMPLVAGDVITAQIIKLRKTVAPSARVGVFDVTSEPSNLKVVVDGRPAGRTPLVGMELKEGSHSLVVEPPAGFEAVRASVRSRPGERVPLHYALSPAAAPAPKGREDAPPGKIVVDSTPWTNVYLGKKLLGPTPVSGVEVPSGKLVLRLSRNADGCTIEATRSIDVAAGGVTRKGFTLEAKEMKGRCE